MGKFLFIAILLLIWSFINIIYSIFLVNCSKEEKEELLFEFSNDMNREQQRQFEKQVNKFKNTFSNFSNYQLNFIKKLIDNIIESRL